MTPQRKKPTIVRREHQPYCTGSNGFKHHDVNRYNMSLNDICYDEQLSWMFTWATT